MCLPVSCLKCVVQFQAWITLLLGFASMVGAIIITIQESKGSEYFVDETNPTRKIMIAVWIFTGVLIFLGICGIVGGHKKISCLLFLYNIGNVIGFLAFLSIGIAAYVIAAEFNFTNKSDCIDSSWGQKLDETYGFGDKVFCQDSCKCYYKDANPPAGIINYADNGELPSQVQKCQSFQFKYSQYENQANLLDFAESTFNCAGWCEPQPYFVFSDVNRGTPNNEGCFLAMTGWFYDNGNLIGDICMGLMGLLGLMIVFTCCLCCHPESKNKDGNFYARMAYYDE